MKHYDQQEDFDDRYLYNSNLVYAKGGQAVILVALDSEENKKVAIKRAPSLPYPKDKYSVYREFNLGKTLRHPNLLKYYGAYQFQTRQGQMDFGVMELIENKLPGSNPNETSSAQAPTLNRYIATVMPDEKEIKDVLLQLLRGLEFLHQKNVIHIDLKPNNILIDYDPVRQKATPKIIDFGISKDLNSSDTISSFSGGTQPYMSPEQLEKRSSGITTSSDLWTFGVVLYELFLSELPFGMVGDKNYSRGRIIQDIFSEKIPNKVNEIPEPYCSIVKRCLVVDVKNRIQSASQIIDLLNGKQESSNNLNTFVDTKHTDGTDWNNTDIDNSSTQLDNNSNGSSSHIRTQLEYDNYKKEASSSNHGNGNHYPPKKKKNRTWLYILLLIVVGVAGYFGYEEYKRIVINDFIDEAIDLFKDGDLDILNYEKSYDNLIKYKDSKHLTPESHYMLGEFYRKNLTGLLDNDDKEALKWYQKAADEDYAKAQLALGDFHKEGRAGLTLSIEKAENYYEKAFDNGLSDGAFSIGNIYYEAKVVDVERDFTKALSWYEKASNKNHAEASYYCGRMYEYGEGTDIDLDKALDYYRKAQDAGYEEKSINRYINNIEGKIKVMKAW
jgi:serine/threonine protein kinase